MGHFKGILVLSVFGRSDLSERSIVKGRNVEAFKCAICEVVIHYAESLPYGCKVNSEYWGNGIDIVIDTLIDVGLVDSVAPFRK
jgi:hypothetical protein